jgi:c-di-GMP-related signal transduction protein
LLPSNQTVVEILENVEPEERVVAACKRLKEAGYLLALDDFAPNDPRIPLCDLADIIKIDLRATKPEERAAMLRSYGSAKCRVFPPASRNQPRVSAGARYGIRLFPGLFFLPSRAGDGPRSSLHYLRLLEMVSRSELDLRELERMIKQETSICYRLLRYLNSPLFGFSLEIKSIRHAMAILGERELRRWVRLVVTIIAAEQKCSELVLMG